MASTTLAAPLSWRNSTLLQGDVPRAVAALKREDGGDLLVIGSPVLARTLLAHDLVDELHLLLYPLTLGGGKRLLPEGVRAEFTLASVTPYRSNQPRT